MNTSLWWISIPSNKYSLNVKNISILNNSVKSTQVLLCITNTSIKHQSFIYTAKCQNCSLSNNSVSHKHTVYFYLVHKQMVIRPEWTWERWHWSTLHSPKLYHFWRKNITSFEVISRILVGGILPLYSDAVGVLFSPSRLGLQYTRWGSLPLWYYSFTTPSWPLVSWLPHVSTGLSLFLSTPTLLSDPRKEKMDEVQSMKVGIRVGEKEKLPSKF